MSEPETVRHFILDGYDAGFPSLAIDILRAEIGYPDSWPISVSQFEHQLSFSTIEADVERVEMVLPRLRGLICAEILGGTSHRIIYGPQHADVEAARKSATNFGRGGAIPRELLAEQPVANPVKTPEACELEDDFISALCLSCRSL
jgi:hypothetical protein